MTITKSNPMKSVRIIASAIILHCTLLSFGQKNNEKQILLDSINNLAYTVNYGENDIIRLNANELLTETLYSTLSLKDNNSLKFDSLKSISLLIAPDNSFKLFTWGFKKEDGTYAHQGILKTINPKTNRVLLFTLKDFSTEFRNPENTTGNADNWYGAIYYKVLPTVVNKKKYYTLLGWNGGNNFVQRKVIEVLSFKANGTPVFGSKLFKKYSNLNAVRVVFEYSKTASMSLIYDTQTYFKNTNQRDPKTKRMIYKPITTQMIVFDRLAPLTESMTGVNQYYVPETNIMDAFIPYQGRWSFVTDIEARNHPKKNDQKKGPKTQSSKRTFYKKTVIKKATKP